MAGDKPISQLPENTSPNDNDFYYTSTPGTPRGDKFIRLSKLKELFGYSKIHDQNTDLGTNSADYTLGFGEDGTVTLYFGEEGHAIRVNKESTPQILEWTNNGTDWNSFGTGGGGPNAVQKSEFVNKPFASTISILLEEDNENEKWDTTLEDDVFTYDHGTVVSGKNAIHNINTGAVSTAIVITWDPAYTYVDGEGNELGPTYEDLPVGAGKNYQIFFLALPGDIILVKVGGVPSESTGGGATNLAATLSASNVIVTSDTGSDATIPAVDGTNAGVMIPTQKTKLDGIATGATANDTDANLKNRANHTGTQAASTISDFDSSVDARVVGAQDLFIPAASMWPRITAPCSAVTQIEISTSIVNLMVLDFDASTQEYAQFQIALPRNWNNGTITTKFYWTATSGSGDVVWSISGGAYSNDDPLSTALGTAQTVTDTLITANDVHVTPETSAITIAGTPADEDYIVFQVSRVAASGSDTLAVDARLLGIRITITTDAAKAA